MKNSLLAFTLISILFSCGKPSPSPAPSTPDNVQPVIKLKGNIKDTVSLGSPYVDQGSIGTDDLDGDISAFVVVSGTVNTNLVGNYQKEYNLRDAAGNQAIQVIRNIHVRNNAYFLAGNYTVACNCATLNPGVDPPIYTNFSYTTSAVISNTFNNNFSIKNVATNSGNPGFETSGVLINSSLDLVEPASNAKYTGTVSVNKNSFVIETEIKPKFTTITHSCNSTFTKMSN